MRILVAGTGAFGREHLARLARHPGLELAAADPDPAALERARALVPLAAAGAEAAALLASFRPQGVIVAAPAAAHVPLAAAALAAGAGVLVEKPVATDAAGARQLAALAAAAPAGAFLLPGHVLRFSAPHRALAGIAASGVLGRLLTLRSRRHRDRGHARLYPDVDPVLMTMIHDIDLGLWVSGAPAASARAVRRTGRGGGTLTEAEVIAENGVRWELAAAWLADGACPPDRVELVGTEGSAEWQEGGPLRLFGPAPESRPPDPGDDPLAVEVAAFLAALGEGPGALPVTPADAVAGIDAAAMILAALERA